MVRLRALGTLSLEGSDRSLRSGLQRKQLALLAILATVPDHRVSRDKLLAWLWPESDAERARNALNQALHVIRRMLGPHIVSGGGTLQLNTTELGCDLWDFTAAVARRDFGAAVTLYEGPFLDGFFLRDSGEFERWAEAARAEYARHYENALEQLARDAELRHDYNDAVTHWRKLMIAQPLSSRAACGLISTLLESGDRAAALQAVRVHEQIVRAELGAPPGPEIAALADRVRHAAAVPNEPVNGTPRPILNPRAVGSLATGEAPLRSQAPPPHSKGRTTRPMLVTLALLLVTVTITGLAVRNGLSIGRRAETKRSTEALDQAKFVVAVFENETGDPKLDYLGSVAAEWVTQGLARLGTVNVVRHSLEVWATPSSATGRDTAQRLTNLALATGAGTVVDGSFVRSGDNLLVLARVVDARTGRVLQSMDPVRGPIGDPVRAIEALRDRVMSMVAARGNPLLEHWVAAAGQPLHFDAYLEYTEGMRAFARWNFPTASAHFERAAAMDSSYTLPLLWLSFSRSNNGERVDSLIAALELRRGNMPDLERALLDYQVANLHRDYEGSYTAATRMAELAPGSEFLYKQAQAAGQLGRPHEAVGILRRMNPNEGWIKDLGWDVDLLGRLEEIIGDYQAALDCFKKLSDQSPTDGVYRQRVLEVLAALGRFREIDSVLAISDVIAAQPEDAGWYSMRAGLPYRTAIALATYGHPAEARRYFGRTLTVLDSLRIAPSAWKQDRAGWIYDEQLRTIALLFLGRLSEARVRAEEVANLFIAHDTGVKGAVEFEAGQGAGAFATLGEVAVLQRDTAEVTRVVAHLRQLQAPNGSADLAQALIAATAGDRDGAVRLLGLAYAHGANRNEPLVKAEFGVLRSYPPFRQLVSPRE